MTHRIWIAYFVITSLFSGLSLAASPQSLSMRVETPSPVNDMCPIGKEPIDGKTFVVHDGRTVGFCCPGCDDAFLAWTKERRDSFVETASRRDNSDGEGQGADEKKPQSSPASPPGDPYILDHCPVSGQKLGSMGKPVVKTIQGREVRFCCGGCVESFESDPTTYWRKADPEIAKQQLPYYPLDTCIVTGEPLTEDGEFVGVDHVYKNRLVRLCCKTCVGKFEADPIPYLTKLDSEIVTTQRKDYPLENCAVVDGSRLGAMGEPAEIVVANRLVRFCCASCLPTFHEDPATFIGRIDKAWKPIHERPIGGHGGR